MPTLKKQESDALQKIVLTYLQGEAIRVIQVHLEGVCADRHLGCKDLYKSIELRDDDDPFIAAILGSLNIKRNGSDGSYARLLCKSKNMHELLTHLYHDGHHHVGYLLSLINKTKPHRNWATIFLLGTLISGGAGAFLYLKKEYIEAAMTWLNQAFPTVIDWLGRTLSLLRNLSLVGIFYNSLGLTYCWYTTFSNGTTSTDHKITNLIARTLTTGLTISAYALTYLAEGVSSWPTALLFVASACVDLLKSIWVYRQTKERLSGLTTPSGDSAWEVIAQHERSKNLSYRSFATVWVKVGAAVFTTIAVAVLNFFPPNLILTISCFLVISLIAKTKETILAEIHERYVHRLQDSINRIAAPKNPELTVANLDATEQQLRPEEKDRRRRAVFQGRRARTAESHGPQRARSCPLRFFSPGTTSDPVLMPLNHRSCSEQSRAPDSSPQVTTPWP